MAELPTLYLPAYKSATIRAYVHANIVKRFSRMESRLDLCKMCFLQQTCKELRELATIKIRMVGKIKSVTLQP